MTHYVDALHAPSYKGRIFTAKDSIDRWSGLSNLSRFLLESKSLHDLMEKTARSVVEILGLDFCRILILEPNGHFYCRMSYSRNPVIVSQKIDFPEPLFAEQIYQWISNSKPALIPYSLDSILSPEEQQVISNGIKANVWLVPLSANSQELGILLLGKDRLKNIDDISIESTHLVDLIAGQLSNAIYRVGLNERLSGTTLEIVQALTKALEVRDISSSVHSKNMAVLSSKMAQLLGCTEQESQNIYWAALLHDIGKIGVEDQILRKPGPLSADEWKVMKQHPQIGAKLVRGMTGMDNIAPLILMHHERMDGSGYPNGLKGDEIPLGARIIAVVDSYTAMLEGRLYRKERSKAEAVAELNRGKNVSYDAKVVETFIQMVS